MLHIFVGVTQRKILCICRNTALIRPRTPGFAFFFFFFFVICWTHTWNLQISCCVFPSAEHRDYTVCHFFPVENWILSESLQTKKCHYKNVCNPLRKVACAATPLVNHFFFPYSSPVIAWQFPTLLLGGTTWEWLVMSHGIENLPGLEPGQ